MSEIIKSIEIALQNEIKERDFYLEQGSRTNNPVGKKMFKSIAEDEDKHYKRLVAIHESLINKGLWPETITEATGKANLKNSVKAVFSQPPPNPDIDIDDIKAVETAIEFETNGHSFYSSLADAAEEQKQSNFFRTLADMEYEHLTSLRDTLLLFKDPQTWFQEHEKPHFEA